jgi:hypothetical protein
MGTVPISGDGVALYYGAIILLALTWLFFCMRLGVRIWRKAFGMDDWLMLVGSVRKPLQNHEKTNILTFVCRFCSQSRQHYALSAVSMVLDSLRVICLP